MAARVFCMIRRAWLTTPTYSQDGAIELRLDTDADIDAVDRRAQRTATLDGGASVYDSGSSAADRTFDVSLVDLSPASVDKIKGWVALYARLWFYTAESAWEVSPASFRMGRGGGQLRLLVTADRTEASS
jgi:hypothetical protein